MKVFIKVVGVLVVLVLALIAFVMFALPFAEDPSDISVDKSPEKVERGRYLVEHVTMCLDCHSEKQPEYLAAPYKLGTEGMGGFTWEGEASPFGTVVAPNITPVGLGSWTDGEIIRSIRTGVTKDGNALTPIMPYHEYSHLSDSDVEAIVAYLRQMKPIENPNLAKTELKMPFTMLVNVMTAESQPQNDVDVNNPVEHGKYLSKVGGCQFCHSPFESGKPVYDSLFAGGHEYVVPSVGIVRTANITPDQKTGIGSWTKEQFIAKFKAYNTPEARLIPAKDNPPTVMPWLDYAGMSEKDLGDVYEYLMSVKPIENTVVKFTPAQ